MNQMEREKFWSALLTMHDTTLEHLNQLQQIIIIPPTLCRFRTVSESSLTQLQENKLYFSTADYYDDPFDTYFYLDRKRMNDQLTFIMSQLSSASGRQLALSFISSLGFPAEVASQAMTSALQNPMSIENLQSNIKDARDQILKTLYSICFCENPLNETLWLKYANNHRGFVVSYDFRDSETFLCGKAPSCKTCPIGTRPPNIYPVYYSNNKYDATPYAISLLLKSSLLNNNVPTPPELLHMIDTCMSWEIERISLLKKFCHVFDDEWRMIYPQWSATRPCIKLKPKNVIIGLRTPEYEKRLILSAATAAGIADIRKIQISEQDELESIPIQ